MDKKINLDKMKAGFTSQDLYLVACVCIATEASPASIINIPHPNPKMHRVQFSWEDANKLPLKEIKNGEIKFSYNDFKLVHQELRNQVINLITEHQIKLKSEERENVNTK